MKMIKIVSKDQLYEGCQVIYTPFSRLPSPDQTVYTVTNIRETIYSGIFPGEYILCDVSWDEGLTKGYDMKVTNFTLVSSPVIDLDFDDDECI